MSFQINWDKPVIIIIASYFSKYKHKNTFRLSAGYGTFGVILSKLITAMEQHRLANPLSKHGRKNKLSIEDQLLLGTQFGISESYAQTRYPTSVRIVDSLRTLIDSTLKDSRKTVIDSTKK